MHPPLQNLTELSSEIIVLHANHGVEEGGQAVDVAHHFPGHVFGVLEGFSSGDGLVVLGQFFDGIRDKLHRVKSFHFRDLRFNYRVCVRLFRVLVSILYIRPLVLSTPFFVFL